MSPQKVIKCRTGASRFQECILFLLIRSLLRGIPKLWVKKISTQWRRWLSLLRIKNLKTSSQLMILAPGRWLAYFPGYGVATLKTKAGLFLIKLGRFPNQKDRADKCYRNWLPANMPWLI